MNIFIDLTAAQPEMWFVQAGRLATPRIVKKTCSTLIYRNLLIPDFTLTIKVLFRQNKLSIRDIWQFRLVSCYIRSYINRFMNINDLEDKSVIW